MAERFVVVPHVEQVDRGRIRVRQVHEPRPRAVAEHADDGDLQFATQADERLHARQPVGEHGGGERQARDDQARAHPVHELVQGAVDAAVVGVVQGEHDGVGEAGRLERTDEVVQVVRRRLPGLVGVVPADHEQHRAVRMADPAHAIAHGGLIGARPDAS
ncbi:MAG: hypothetical protein JNK15_05325 [Planctomycetes bacterium]|nr:hypothetical protein [Planctomycetota bacterium]